jgi:protein SCO1/2
MYSPSRAAPIAVLALTFVAFQGCGGPRSPIETDDSAELETYQLRGEIVRLLPDDELLVVKHGDVEGWMEAMTMEFPVADPADLTRLSEGDRIEAEVRVRGLDYRLANIRVIPADEPAEATPPQ